MDSTQSILRSFATTQSALLPALHALQAQLGFIAPDTFALIAQHFNLSKAEVHGVVSYYDDFSTQPPKPHRLRVCMAEACHACGAEQLWEQVQAACASNPEDIALSPVYCLGLCANGPVLTVNEALYAQVDAARLERVLKPVLEASTVGVPT